MNQNEKKLIQLRTKLWFYKKLDKKIEKVMIDELDVCEWSEDVCDKIAVMEKELYDLKREMNIPDEKFNEDEDW